MNAPELSPAPAPESLPPALATSPVASAPPHGTLVAALEAAARDQLPFVTFYGVKDARPLDFPGALEGARRWARLLQSRGVGRGDRVPVLLPTGPAFLQALFGAMLAGAAPVPLASPMTFGSVDRYLVNLAAIVADSGARCIVTYPRIAEAVAGHEVLREALTHVVTEGDLPSDVSHGPAFPSLDGRDTAFIQYTSGTTGRPKGAVISHGALTANAFAIAHGLGITPSDVGVSWLPLFHDMGLIGVMLTGVCHPYPLHIMPPEVFVMRPGRWLDVVARAGGTLSAAPNFAYDLTTTRGDDPPEGHLGTWRAALNGSEPVHRATVERFARRFERVGFRPEAALPVYGLAESTLAVCFPKPGTGVEVLRVDRAALEEGGRAVLSDREDAAEAVSVGRPVAGSSVKIIDPEGAVVRERTVGEVCVSGPSLMDGYFHNPEATGAVLSDGWLRTGDLGFLEGGRLYIVGRAKEMIIKGGRNVYPYDLERVTGDVSGVRRGGVAAFGRFNPEAGTDDIIVVAETDERDPAAKEKITREVRGELLAVLGVKADEVHLWRVGAIPRTTSGKVQRKECLRRLAQGGKG